MVYLELILILSIILVFAIIGAVVTVSIIEYLTNKSQGE